ncbi:MAG: site-2 protease family protein [Thermoanaerobaculaceae bacterium]|nr:site-2 protease family protein [Thermoanaerobaculaceae bacterium]
MPDPGLEVEIIGPDGVPVGVVRRTPPPPQRVWLHVVLFLATLASTTLVGGIAFGDLPAGFKPATFWDLIFHPAVITAGFEFSVPLLVILLAHEMGHYVACRYHRLDATLPFFIPVPFGIGTLGALIRIRSPLLTKRELFDVGASGPLAGFAVALPVLVAGIALSTPVAALPSGGAMIFGEPLAFKALAWLVHTDVPPGGDLLLHPVGFAAWFGLLVTALNLLPFGQLDGGHVTYAMFGRWQRRVAWPLLAVLVVLGFWWPGWWLWAFIALVMRVRHPWIPDEHGVLDRRRRILGWVCLAVFIVCFTPEPIKILP